MKAIFLTIILIFLFIIGSAGQKYKFGKVSLDELKLGECEFYAEANSYIIYKSGVLQFTLDDNKQEWGIKQNVVVRKKIFKIERDESAIDIFIYNPIDEKKNTIIKSIKGVTYNLNDKSIEKTKLAKENIFETRVDDNWMKVSFIMPKLMDGSVIEYKYTYETNNLSSLPTMVFQENIPVGYCSFEYTIPEFFRYQVSQLGESIVLEDKQGTVIEKFRYTYTNIARNRRENDDRQITDIRSESQYRKLVGKRIPPILDEPFVTNKIDQPARLEFQLIAIDYPNSPVKNVAGSYARITEELLESPLFGMRLNKGKFAETFVAGLNQKNEYEKAEAIYNWLANYFTWNNEYSYFSDKNTNDVYKDGKGDVGEINLTLIAALRKAGLKAYPVILSTRGNGSLHPVYPRYIDFNYVIAVIEIDNKYYFADATGFFGFGTIPSRCLNGQGWLIKEKSNSGWIDLKGYSSFKKSYFSQMKFRNDSLLIDMMGKYSGYAAFDALRNYEENGEDDYKSQILSNFTEAEINEFNFSNQLKQKGYVTSKLKLTQHFENADIYYIPLVQTGVYRKNPFKREERKMNIDFPYKYNLKTIVILDVPFEYKVEVPESILIKLPDNNGIFEYRAEIIGNKVHILSHFKLNKLEYSLTDYPQLKEFFQMMVDKNNEYVVLIKQ
jgi:Transglutaminase-like superfamily